MSDAIPTPRLYLGRFQPVLDLKHRITIPSAWREKGSKAEQFFVMASRDGRHIDVFPPRKFYSIYEAIQADQAVGNTERRAFSRTYYSDVQECTTDAQGRMLLPEQFCQAAELSGEVLLLGVGSSMEIWSPSRWEEARPVEEARARTLGELHGL